MTLWRFGLYPETGESPRFSSTIEDSGLWQKGWKGDWRERGPVRKLT